MSGVTENSPHLHRAAAWSVGKGARVKPVFARQLQCLTPPVGGSSAVRIRFPAPAAAPGAHTHGKGIGGKACAGHTSEKIIHTVLKTI